ncbi:hypothetical protein [Mucilaginibacter sp.]|uniref:hypothetical protein n=1 Tax=Mucilaginibacter sp. TaxID=1882438 RepID=UPI003264AC03
MHSPWGKNFNIIKELGFTWHQLMWKISWINLQMMLADAPSYKTRNKDKVKKATSFDDFADFMD